MPSPAPDDLGAARARTDSVADGHGAAPAAAAVLAHRWRVRHPGHEATGLLYRWLRLCWWLARPLAAARVSPDAVTVLGAAAAVRAARTRSGIASAWLLGSALADGLDGAVAVLRDVDSGHGELLDHAADRVGDVAAAAVLSRAGAPWWLLAPAAVGAFGLEWRRDPAVPIITVAERPSRIVCAVLGDVVSAATRRRWPAVVAAVVWDVLTLVAVVQRLRAVRRLV